MENFSREMEKDLMPNDTYTQKKRNRNWQLLFVDDHGKMISFSWFKSAAILIVATLFISIVCSFLFFVLFQKNLHENIILKEKLEESGKRIKNLRNEMDILNTKMVLTESKNKQTVPPKNTKPAIVSRKKSVTQNADKEVKKKIVSYVQELDIMDFKISNNSSSGNTLQISFMIKNKDRKVKTATGYIFVVLKQDEQDYTNWLSIPSVELKGGLPVNKKRGKFFKISRFKTIYFRVNTLISPDLFKTATVFVFHKNGDKIFEKSFPVAIKTVYSNSSQTNSNNIVSEKNVSEVTSSVAVKENPETKLKKDDTQEKDSETKETESVFVEQADEIGKMPTSTELTGEKAE